MSATYRAVSFLLGQSVERFFANYNTRLIHVKKIICGENKNCILYIITGNANRWWGILKYPPSAKNFENTPLKILGNIFEK